MCKRKIFGDELQKICRQSIRSMMALSRRLSALESFRSSLTRPRTILAILDGSPDIFCLLSPAVPQDRIALFPPGTRGDIGKQTSAVSSTPRPLAMSLDVGGIVHAVMVFAARR